MASFILYFSTWLRPGQPSAPLPSLLPFLGLLLRNLRRIILGLPRRIFPATLAPLMLLLTLWVTSPGVLVLPLGVVGIGTAPLRAVGL